MGKSFDTTNTTRINDLLNMNNIRRFYRDTSLGAVLAEKFNCSTRDFLQKPSSDRAEANSVDVLPTRTKQYIERFHSSTKLGPIQAS